MRLVPKIKQYILLRMPRGCITKGLLFSYQNHLKYSEILTMRLLYMWLVNYTLGTAFCFKNRAYPNHVTSKLRVLKPLYHMCYHSDLTSIQKHGLRNSRGIIYLTDDTEIMNGYFCWKDPRKPTSLVHHIAILDTAKILRDGITIFETTKPHEFLTESIPPDYITKIVPFEDLALAESV